MASASSGMLLRAVSCTEECALEYGAVHRQSTYADDFRGFQVDEAICSKTLCVLSPGLSLRFTCCTAQCPPSTWKQKHARLVNLPLSRVGSCGDSPATLERAHRSLPGRFRQNLDEAKQDVGTSFRAPTMLSHALLQGFSYVRT